MLLGKLGFCLNSRRWLIHAIDPRSCPYIGSQGEVNCVGVGCGYYEERDPPQDIVETLAMVMLAGLQERGVLIVTYGADVASKLTSDGVNHGTDGAVLLRHGERELVWRPGWCLCSGGSERYIRSCVQVLWPRVGWGTQAERVFKGRFSRKALFQHAGRIEGLMQFSEDVPVEAVLMALEKNKTVVLSD